MKNASVVFFLISLIMNKTVLETAFRLGLVLIKKYEKNRHKTKENRKTIV